MNVVTKYLNGEYVTEADIIIACKRFSRRKFAVLRERLRGYEDKAASLRKVRKERGIAR